MTLHEAIEKLLHQVGRPMTTTEITDALNRNKWYQKKDNSPITPYQIHCRTSKYPHLFNRNGSTVSLIGQPFVKVSTSVMQLHKAEQPIKELSNDNTLLEKI